MTRSVKAAMSATRLATAFAATLSVSAWVVSAQAIESLPASASIVRNSVVAMSIADAALPAAIAAARAEFSGAVPTSSAAMKSDVSRAMASMQPTSRRSGANVYNAAYNDRRVRPYYSPFVLMLGVGY